jgi:hypothetical protein
VLFKERLDLERRKANINGLKNNKRNYPTTVSDRVAHVYRANNLHLTALLKYIINIIKVSKVKLTGREGP